MNSYTIYEACLASEKDSRNRAQIFAYPTGLSEGLSWSSFEISLVLFKILVLCLNMVNKHTKKVSEKSEVEGGKMLRNWDPTRNDPISNLKVIMMTETCYQ